MPQSFSDLSLVSPIHLEDSEIVLRDDELEEEDTVLDIEEYTCTNREGVNLENAAVNIDNSNDVIIGPVTQFNVSGNVTIYQNGTREQEAIDGHIANKEEESNTSNSTSTDGEKGYAVQNLNWWSHNFKRKAVDVCRDKKYIRVIILILILVISAMVAYVILANKTKENVNNDEVYLGTHRVYSKEDWGGKPPTSYELLTPPQDLVIISHSGTSFCYTFQSCSSSVRSFQNTHFSINCSDIGYNFIIGGDASIYIGRGWDVKNFHKQKSIGINFVGDFNSDQLSKSMIDATKLLLERGLAIGALSTSYRLVGHNQTTAMVPHSPGENAYEEIKSWPHFSNETLF